MIHFCCIDLEFCLHSVASVLEVVNPAPLKPLSLKISFELAALQTRASTIGLIIGVRLSLA